MGQVVICQPTANFSFTPIFHSRKISFQTSSLLDLCILWPSPLAFIWSWNWFQKSSRKERYFSSRRSFFSREVQQVAQSSGSSRYTLFANWQLGRYQNWSPTADICWSYFQFQLAAGIPLQAMTTKQEKETTDDVSMKQSHLFPHVLQLRLLRRKRWHIFPIFALLYKLPPNYYRSASVKQGANICFGLPPIAISPKLSKISPPKYFERNTAPSPRYGYRLSHRKDWK